MNKKIIIVFCFIIAIIVTIIIFKDKFNKTNSEKSDSNNPKETVQETPTMPDKEQPTEEPKEKKEEKSNDLFGEYYEKANEIMDTMTLEEKVGQMFFVRYPDYDANSEIQTYNPGGYILFARDFKYETPESILAKINENQSNSKVKMLIGVDEEGGTVNRVSWYTAYRSSEFQSPQELWAEGKMERILEDSTEKSNLLKSIGINVNLAPVVDIPTDTSSFIYERSFGKGAEETAEYTKQVIKRMREDKMISAMKHFPGYGDNVDTHTGIAVDTRNYEGFKEADYLPFIAGIKEGAPMILVNHNIINCMDTELPASLSKNVHNELRNVLNFSGLIITDDLAMDAVKEYVNDGKAAVQAVLAGNDLIISSDFVNQRNEVLEAINNGIIDQDIINNAVRRIISCKIAYGIV